ncbi:MAG: hypothetical protein RLY93_20555 [Sumerlaeia bacterium]
MAFAKIREMHEKLGALRRQGYDATLASILEDEYNQTPQEMLRELSINPRKHSVDFVLNLADDRKWLVPEVFRSAIREGFVRAWYREVVAADERVAQPSVVVPSFEYSDAEPKTTAEGESVPVGSVSYKDKTVRLHKHTIGLDISYEAIKYTSLDLAAVFFEDFGSRLAGRLNAYAVSVLENGDQSDLSHSAAVIGVNDTTPGITYADELRLFIRGAMIGRRFSKIVASEEAANVILNLAEHRRKTTRDAAAELPLNVKTPVPEEADLYADAHVTANRAIFVDPARALALLTASALEVESQKIIEKQIEKSVASVTAGFASLVRDGRVALDGSIAYAGNGFPAYMTPVKSTFNQF